MPTSGEKYVLMASIVEALALYRLVVVNCGFDLATPFIRGLLSLLAVMYFSALGLLYSAYGKRLLVVGIIAFLTCLSWGINVGPTI